MSTMSMNYHGLDTNTYCPHCGELIPSQLVTLRATPIIPIELDAEGGGLDFNPNVHYCDHDREYCDRHAGGPGCNMADAIPSPNVSTFERKCTKCGEKYDADAFCPTCRSDQLLIEEENKKIRKDVENSTIFENFILEYDKKNE